MTDALVMIHGYNPEGMAGGKNPATVWEDRLEQGYETADQLDDYGADVTVAISGGIEHDGQTEAEIVHEHAQEYLPGLLEDHDVVLEDGSVDTESSVQHVYDVAQEEAAEAVYAVTSRDHAPRMLRDWQSFLDDQDTDMDVYAVGSSETYAASDRDPFIVEAAAFEPFIDAFDEVWGIDPERYAEAAEAVTETLQEFK